MATALVAAGSPAVETAVAQAPSAAAPGDDAAAVHTQLQRNAQQLAQVKLPMETEPAVHFKA